MTIEANIRAYLLLAAPGAQVKQAPYEGDRPAGDYLTYQIINVLENQAGWKTTYAAGKDTLRTSAVITVSVNAYAAKGYQYLSNAKALGSAWEGRMALKADDIAMAFMQGGGTGNLTGLGDTGFRSRYQCDLMFHADLTHERTRSLINQWKLSGNFVAGDDIVDGSIDVSDVSTSGGKVVKWGSIRGDIDDQSDLAAALLDVNGVTYTQDYPPANPSEQETWYNPLTLQLQVYNDAAWRPVSPDGGYF